MPNPFLVDQPQTPDLAAGGAVGAAPIANTDLPRPDIGGLPAPSSDNPFAVAPVGQIEDIARSAGAGAQLGAAGALGGLGDLTQWASRGLTWLMSHAGEKLGIFSPEESAKLRGLAPLIAQTGGTVTTPEALGNIETLTKTPLYQPQTVPGEYTRTIMQFAPMAAFGGGGVGARLAQTVVPAVASETAGQIARGTAPDLEPYARVGGALAGGVGVGLSMRSSPEAAIGRHMGGATAQDVGTARQLMSDAATAGVPLTWQEALDAVTNGATDLSSLMRVVGNMRGGASVMRPMIAERPGQVQAAASQELAQFAPQRPMNAVETGIAAQQAAKGAVTDTQRAINQVTRPYYSGVEATTVAPAVQAALTADPIYAQTLRQVRADPTLNAMVANLPDDSVGVINLVQQRLRELQQNAATPGTASPSNIAAANLGASRQAAITGAQDATGGPLGPYGMARTGQEMLRSQFLDPMTQGPVGAISATSNVGTQGRALLPANPPPGFAPVATDAALQIAAQNPDAARGLVSSRLRGVFDVANKGTQAGPSPAGGARFVNALTGNNEAAQTLEGTVRGLYGDARWLGFRRFMDILAATGRNPQMGSPTSPNQVILQELGGGMVPTAMTAGLSLGTNLLKRLRDFGEQMALAGTSTKIARIMTDPASGRLLERLAVEPQGSGRAAMLAYRLTYMGNLARSTRPEKNAPPQ